MIVEAALSLFLLSMTAEDIAKKMDGVNRGKDVEGKMELSIINNRGTKKDRHLLFSRISLGDEERLYFEFDQPADVKGTKFLFWSHPEKDNSVWMFLPALKKMRRLAGSSRYESFMGSDFLYEDLTKRSIQKDKFSGGKLESCGQQKCYILEAVPRDDLPYGKRKIWVHSEHFLPTRIEYFDKEGKLLKTQENMDIQNFQNIWTVFLSKMTKSDSSSESSIQFRNLQYNRGLQEKDFSVGRLR